LKTQEAVYLVPSFRPLIVVVVAGSSC